MADVKWIKIVTDIFDDEKMLLIESLPSADSIMIIWFKLLCLAGKNNNSGVFIFNDRIPYTDEMLASIFRRDINTVRLALTTFEQFGMAEIINDVITLPNWDKHQTLDSYEKKKVRDRVYQAERREKQRFLTSSSDESSDKSSYVAVSEEDKEEDKDKEEDIERDMSDARRPAPRQNAPYEKIMALYNRDCPSLSACKLMSEARKKAIRARMAAGYTTEDFETLFAMAEASTFLKGSNDRDWRADFDWLIKDANMAKVLDGKYGNRQNAHKIEKSGNPFLDMLNAEGDKGDDQDRND